METDLKRDGTSTSKLWWALPLTVCLMAGLAYAVPQDRGDDGDDYELTYLRVFNRVVLLVKEQYVDRSRINPREMFLAALSFVEKRVPEVLIEEPPIERRGRQIDAVSVVVGGEREDFFLDDLSSVWQISFKLRNVFAFIDGRISSDVDRREIEYAAVNGMLSKLDPHSVLLEPRSSEEMKLSTKGEFGGLGIVISIRDGWLTVISPIDGTPADRAGIQALDRIVKIGEESTINMGLDEAVERLRGPKGTQVTIYITRKGVEEPRKVVITRDTIRVQSVTHELIDNRLGYVKIKQFQGRTSEDLLKAVDDMRAQAGKELDGLILDLRNNPGGLLDQSVEVSNLFLDDGVIVVTQEGGTRQARQEVRAFQKPGKIHVPLVVLVNGGSASASEIVSGAIKNRQRGLIVGDQTFGKGSVQQLYDFPDGSSLKLTIGQYLTPGDESIQSVGITPDVLVRPIIADDKDSVNLFPDREAREEDLAAHLDDSRIKARKPTYELAYLSETLDESERQRIETSSKFHEDFEIRFAKRVLAKTKAEGRDPLLKSAGVVVEEVHQEQNKTIVEAMKKLGVDWSQGHAKSGQLTVRPTVESPVAKAGEEVTITLEAENTGTEPIYRAKGISKSTLWHFADREFLFGTLQPGQKTQWTFKTKIPKDIVARHDLMRVDFSDGDGHELGALDLPVTIQGVARPRFSYAMFIDDSASGNGDGLLQVGESVELVVNVQNNGEGPAETPMALLKNLGGPELFIENGRQHLGALKPGASEAAKFSFKVREKKNKVKLRLQVFDSDMGDFLVEKLEFDVRTNKDVAKRSKKTVKVTSSATVLAAADNNADIIARAGEGVKLDAVSEVGPYFRVRIGKELYGYVPAGQVRLTQGRATVGPKGTPKGLSSVFGRDPPRIQIPGVTLETPMVTDGDTAKFDVLIGDEGPVRDVYVFVGEEKRLYKKLGGDGRTEVTIPVEVGLEPGVNVITVVAREDDEFAQREVFTVYSKTGDPLAEDKKLERH